MYKSNFFIHNTKSLLDGSHSFFENIFKLVENIKYLQEK